MAMSRSAKIILLLVIDILFFWTELIVGCVIGSFALIADSFHMLSDILGLIVALGAIKLAARDSPDSRYSYGFHRAEILAALVNGVFLLALCFSISLEAVQRFVQRPEISDPRLIVIVGSLGLVFNVIGLLIFHEHGHSHENVHGSSSSPPHVTVPSDVKVVSGDTTSGKNYIRSPRSSFLLPVISELNSTEADVPDVPCTDHIPIRKHNRLSTDSYLGLYGHLAGMIIAQDPASKPPNNSVPSADTTSGDATHIADVPVHSHNRPRPTSLSSLYGHPAVTRASIIQAANELALARTYSPPRRGLHRLSGSFPLDVDRGLHGGHPINTIELEPMQKDNAVVISSVAVLDESRPSSSDGYSRSQTSPPKQSHSHHDGSMNMRAVALHVLGDAIGNVGVIVAGLVIWLTSWHGRFYLDPAISIFIASIICSSAWPVVRSASFILLQGVPATISLEQVRSAILDVEGVLSVHELHIWQLSETKIVASAHVLASRDQDFMLIAARICKTLHQHGIHSSTIQPEYHNERHAQTEEHPMTTPESSCLILCPADQACDPSKHACCPPPLINA